MHRMFSGHFPCRRYTVGPGVSMWAAVPRLKLPPLRCSPPWDKQGGASHGVCSVQCLCAARKAAVAGVAGKAISCQAPWASWCTGPSVPDQRKRMGMTHLCLPCFDAVLCAISVISLGNSQRPGSQGSLPQELYTHLPHKSTSRRCSPDVGANQAAMIG